MSNELCLDAAVQAILSSLGSVRAPVVFDERALHVLIEQALLEGGVRFEREARIAPRCRVDFLCDGGIVIEVKRGKPYASKLLPQIRRYAACDGVSAVVVVVERTARVPGIVGGKPCVLFGLNRLWGIAI